MKKVTIKCPDMKRPAKVCDLTKDKAGRIRMEIKYPGYPKKVVIELNEYLRQLGVESID